MQSSNRYLTCLYKVAYNPYSILLQDDSARKVIVHVEKIFRGRHYKEPIEIFRVSYKPDYRLIPKDEEQDWWDRLANCKPRVKIVPGSFELPPLMKVTTFINIYLLKILNSLTYIFSVGFGEG